MRVFLKVQAGPIATAGAGSHAEPPRTNGNGGSHPPNGEASAFRELLTEFRNLTERYGQALLALGESRGEVAGLRSRVDLLEARLDLRLPPARDEAPIAWEAQPPLPSPEATARGAADAPAHGHGGLVGAAEATDDLVDPVELHREFDHGSHHASLLARRWWARIIASVSASLRSRRGPGCAGGRSRAIIGDASSAASVS